MYVCVCVCVLLFLLFVLVLDFVYMFHFLYFIYFFLFINFFVCLFSFLFSLALLHDSLFQSQESWPLRWDCQVQDAKMPGDPCSQGILIEVCFSGGMHLNTKALIVCRFQHWTSHDKPSKLRIWPHAPTDREPKVILSSWKP